VATSVSVLRDARIWYRKVADSGSSTPFRRNSAGCRRARGNPSGRIRDGDHRLSFLTFFFVLR
jgi:hypothetical protein